MDFLEHAGSFLSGKEMSVPLGQVIVFTFLVSISMFLGRLKLGLLISFSFVFYWGFFYNRVYFTDLLGNTQFGLYIYVLCGVVTLILSGVGFFRE